MNRAAASSAAGFTLVELLVSLVLMAVMASTISVTIGQLRSIETAQKRLQQLDAADAVVAAIARDLEGAVRLPLIEAGSTSSVLFRGDADSMTFSAIVPVGYRRRGLREVTYQISKDEPGSKVSRSTRLRRFSPGESVVSDDLGPASLSLRLRYLVSRQDGASAWEDQFSTINSLPQAVLLEASSPISNRIRSTQVVRLNGK